MFMVNYIKRQLKALILNFYFGFSRLKEIYFLSKIKFVKSLSMPFVFLGFQDNKNRGGGLKLQDLKSFLSPTNEYNNLYLLSSSLPYAYKEMIRKAKKSGAKIIWNQNGIGFPAWAGPNYKKVNQIFKMGIENADMVVFQSNFAMQSVNDLVTPIGNINKKVVYNAVDLTLFQPRSSTDRKNKQILVAGSHNNINRVLFAIEIFALLMDENFNFELKIAGKIKPADFKRVSNLISAKNISQNIYFHGQYNRKEAPSLFSQADILLHLQPFDPCPTVVLEAMACGLVIVGPNNGGIPEFLGDELIFQLVENETTYNKYDWGKPEIYAEKIMSLLPMLNTLKIKARERTVEHFDVRDWIKYHTEIFESKYNFTKLTHR